ncbi:hypothetical protein K437DRAFT_256823 [Tilletiaria anomala UBC 951]|uniref:TFIIS central domain-containing protein n=1 Tax=Tilletiaria anomala (strain ATCC 24038 / CBS 436.72 / UBC 951) TaxID=1037660 RepID=A0A066VTB8_TILAU|nr:uncharacterized protein K437DRAFT_256823 [Tilletiaria anomala UBC 951]KDN44957.1 hypothetical protein K437DRAFT_256823 [Tilletiaria anomala UBC 951]
MNQFNAVLEQILRETKVDIASPSAISVDTAMLLMPVEQRASEYSAGLEAAMWAAYAEPHPKTKAPSAGKAYRDRLRTVLFNLKDKNNHSLHVRIASNQLPSEKLATLPSDELANDTIRLAVEKAKREALEQSILKKETGPMRKITHKGEEDIEFEAGNQMRHEDSNKKRHDEEHNPGSHGPIGQGRKITTMDQGVLSPSMQSPSTPFTPTFAGSGSPPPDRADSGTPERSLGTSSQPQSAPAALPAPRRSTSSIMSPTSAQTEFNMDSIFASRGSHVEGEELGDDDMAVIVDGGAMEDVHEEHGDPFDEANAVNADDIMDALDASQSDPLNDSHPERTLTAASDAKAEQEKPKPKLHLPSGPIWHGAFTMPEEATFSGTARQIAGRPLGAEQDVWDRFFTAPHIELEGRLPTHVACKYLVECFHAARTEVIVLVFDMSFELSALANADEKAPLTESANKTSYEKFAASMRSRQRYAVIPAASSARGKVIKDFYLAPLLKDDAVPDWLDLLRPPRFVRQGRENDLFLLVAVLNKGALEADLAARRRPPVSAPLPAPGLTSALPGGGAALQDLLKAVGKGAIADSTIPRQAPPSTEGSDGTATVAGRIQDLHMVNAPAPTLGNQLAPPTAAALQQMGTPQLESFLHANPIVVDQLLNTLKASGTLLQPPPTVSAAATAAAAGEGTTGSPAPAVPAMLHPGGPQHGMPPAQHWHGAPPATTGPPGMHPQAWGPVLPTASGPGHALGVRGPVGWHTPPMQQHPHLSGGPPGGTFPGAVPQQWNTRPGQGAWQAYAGPPGPQHGRPLRGGGAGRGGVSGGGRLHPQPNQHQQLCGGGSKKGGKGRGGGAGGWAGKQQFDPPASKDAGWGGRLGGGQ